MFNLFKRKRKPENHNVNISTWPMLAKPTAWQYATVNVPTLVKSIDDIMADGHTLRSIGAAGFELLGVAQSIRSNGYPDGYTYYFKRAKLG